jgi:hypothetical protein
LVDPRAFGTLGPRFKSALSHHQAHHSNALHKMIKSGKKDAGYKP